MTVTVGGAPGVVDSSFNGGAQLTSVAEGEDYAHALAVQADGKVITAGHTSTNAGGTDIAIVRHSRDGTLDAGFGNGGKVTTDFGGDTDRAYSLVLPVDGKIVAGGSASFPGSTGIDFALARYNPDGTLMRASARAERSRRR